MQSPRGSVIVGTSKKDGTEDQEVAKHGYLMKKWTDLLDTEDHESFWNSSFINSVSSLNG